MLFMLVAGLLSSNMILKKEYDKVDKSDIYWTFGNILEQPFKYLKIKGGNITNIAFEQSSNCSVRVLRDWEGYHERRVKAFVKNDTLFVDFPDNPKNMYEKFWMKGMTLVRIFSPELLSVDGFDTKFEMFKLKQKSLTVSMSGKSTFEVESLIPGLDTLHISQKDSSEVIFEMSPEYKSVQSTSENQKVIIDQAKPGLVTLNPPPQQIKSDETMTIQSVNANLQGYTLLDLGHAQIKSLQLTIADSSAIILSGGTLKKVKE
jgi:hypothetical protein